MAGTIRSVRDSAVEETDSRHDRRNLFQKPVWTSKSGSTQKIRKGDHVWCHVRGYKKAIQHHGISDGSDGVYHYDSVEGDDKDGKPDYYSTCPTCISMLNQRKEAGLPSTGVRFNCLSCFSHGKKVYLCEYGASFVELARRETGSRSTQVCNRSGEDVVREAKRFYEHDAFGKYEVMSCNCEDFARWCKIEKLGSKQVMRAEVLAGVLGGSVVGSALTYVSLKGIRKLHERKLLKLENPVEKPLTL